MKFLNIHGNIIVLCFLAGIHFLSRKFLRREGVHSFSYVRAYVRAYVREGVHSFSYVRAYVKEGVHSFSYVRAYVKEGVHSFSYVRAYVREGVHSFSYVTYIWHVLRNLRKPLRTFVSSYVDLLTNKTFCSQGAIDKRFRAWLADFGR